MFSGCGKSKQTDNEEPKKLQHSVFDKNKEQEPDKGDVKIPEEPKKEEPEVNPEEPEVKPVQPQLDFSTLDNTATGWGFKKNQGAPPSVSTATAQLLEKYNGFYIGDTNSKKIYLTFDEGYENGYTAGILDVLKANNVKAAFFVTGSYVSREPDLVKRMVNEGHIVGNHSVNHPSLPKVSDEELEAELKDLDKMVEDLTGVKMKYVRPPQGEYSERVLAKISNMGYKTVFWSFAYKDWDTTLQQGTDYAYNQVMPYIDGGAVLLLHAVSSDNAGALDKIIKDVKAQGYEFCSIDDIK